MSKHNEDGELLKSIRPPSSENQHIFLMFCNV